MLERVVAFILILIAIALPSLAGRRMKLFKSEETGGRFSFFAGWATILFASVGHLVMTFPDYSEWFVESAYSYLYAAQFGLFILGVALLTVGIVGYVRFWDERQEIITVREGKLSLLQELQRNARQPYQLLELLNIVISETVYHSPATAGVFLLNNPTKRQFVLGSASGLDKKEIASFERYPYERNLATQSMELGDVLIGGKSDDISNQVSGRFGSTVAVPIIAGSEKVGVMLLFAEESHQFSASEALYLSPVAEWLAERIRGTRLSRELSRKSELLDSKIKERDAMLLRFQTAGNSLISEQPVGEVCRVLIGLLETESAHVIGLQQGSFTVYGGSEALEELSEHFRAALITALDSRKPLVINQESQDKSGPSSVYYSNLIVPIDSGGGSDALLLRRQGRPYKVSNEDIKAVRVFASVLGAAVSFQNLERLQLTRRKGIDSVLSLLRMDGRLKQFVDDPEYLSRLLSTVLPQRTMISIFERNDDGRLHAVSVTGSDFVVPPDFMLTSGEGDIGRSASDFRCRFVAGRKNIIESLGQYDSETRLTLQNMFGERGTPLFVASCPIITDLQVVGVYSFFMFEGEDIRSEEWERLLTLLTGLYSLRLTLASETTRSFNSELDAKSKRISGNLVNKLNNHLSAVVGAAEVASQDSHIDGVLMSRLHSIISEAEQAAAVLSELRQSRPEEKEDRSESIGSTIEDILSRARISGDLHMTGGRPREIKVELVDESIPVVSENVGKLFEAALDRFSSLADDDDVISIVSYKKENALFLDVSRHRRNFPAVDRVAEFGRYLDSSEAYQERPTEVFLEHALNMPCQYAVDRTSNAPSYLSFRFPLKSSSKAIRTDDDYKREIRILAIDDHPVILDLVKAMGNSLGYSVDTASNGTEGVKLARETDYDLVMTDLAMPDISGLETARQIRKISPDLPIILVTGWETNISNQELEAAGIISVLYKPFRIEQLTELVLSSVAERR